MARRSGRGCGHRSTPLTLLANGFYVALQQVTAYDGLQWANALPPVAVVSSNLIHDTYSAYRVPTQPISTGGPGIEYVGLDLGWGDASIFTPASILGLNVWLDASQLILLMAQQYIRGRDLAVGGTAPTVETGINTMTYKTNAANGKGVVRFMAGNSSHLHGVTTAVVDYTMIYVTRRWGPICGSGVLDQVPRHTTSLSGSIHRCRTSLTAARAG